MFSSSFVFFSANRSGGGKFVHQHWLRRSEPKTINQEHNLGPMYNKRRFFPGIRQNNRIMMKRISGMTSQEAKSRGLHFNRAPTAMHRHLAGDARREPDENFYFEKRVDKVEGIWNKRGRYQLHHVGGKTEIFVCFRCGYPVKSKLQVIKDDNWDYRMCYNCYTSTVQNGDEEH